MFIYQITNLKNNLSYIGLDTHDEYKQKRWKAHKRDCLKKKNKFYNALCLDIDNFSYEVIYRTNDIEDLLLKEIFYIEKYDSYRNGYNSSPGGDAFGHRNLKDISKESYDKIITIRREWTRELNKKKWDDTTAEERKFLCKHLHTPEIISKRAETLKDYYNSVNGARESKLPPIRDWQENNRDQMITNNKKNGLLGSQKVSKKIKIEHSDGKTEFFNSKSEFNKKYGEIINAVIKKTSAGLSHRGFKGWEI